MNVETPSFKLNRNVEMDNHFEEKKFSRTFFVLESPIAIAETKVKYFVFLVFDATVF